ncbi:MAG: hypothetical protein JW889_07950 [Verrucomicrobia bacterium]|nr:hypothetical protein [Verrucomicrobiota bacterium]
MGVTDLLKSLFGGKAKTLESISSDELRRERIRIEQEEARHIKKLDELERDKQSLFEKGTDEPSQRQQIIVARKIKELDQQGRNYDQTLKLLSRQLRIISGFLHVKENKALLEKTAVSSLLAKMDLADLQRFVEAATVEGQFQMDKFEHILTTLEDYDLDSTAASEDTDTIAIVEAMNRARSAKNVNPEAAIREGVAEIDRILRKDQEPA